MVTVIVLVLFLGPWLFDLEYNNTVTDFYDELEYSPTNKCVHYTMIYHSFVMLTIFLMINSRKIGEHEFNIFEDMKKSRLFISIVVIVFLLQIFFV
jgi:Ca2+ transporting ATPase